MWNRDRYCCSYTTDAYYRKAKDNIEINGCDVRGISEGENMDEEK